MKQTLRVVNIKSSSSYVCKDAVGRFFTVDTDRRLQVGQSVKLVNGIVVGVVQNKVVQIFEV